MRLLLAVALAMSPLNAQQISVLPLQETLPRRPGMDAQVGVLGDLDGDDDLDGDADLDLVGSGGRMSTVWINEHRHARMRDPARVGGRFRRELESQPGHPTGPTTAIPFLRAAVPTNAIPLPRGGALQFEPFASLALPAVVISLGELGVLEAHIPADGLLDGAAIVIQAFCVDPPDPGGRSERDELPRRRGHRLNPRGVSPGAYESGKTTDTRFARRTCSAGAHPS